jgi:hypothetical protein
MKIPNLSWFIDKDAPGYRIRQITYGDGALDYILRALSECDPTELSRFGSLVSSPSIIREILSSHMGQRAASRGTPLMTPESLKSAALKASPDVSSNPLYLVLLGFLFTRIGLMRANFSVQIPSRRRHVFINEERLIQEIRYKATESWDNWLKPLDTIADRMYANVIASPLNECLQLLYRMRISAEVQVRRYGRAKEILAAYISERDIGPLADSEDVMDGLLEFGQLFISSLQLAQSEEFADVTWSYYPFDDQTALANTQKILSSMDGEIKLVRGSDVRDWYSVIPILDEREKELRLILVAPSSVDPRVNFKLHHRTEADEFYPNASIFFDVQSGAAGGASSMMDQAAKGAVSSASYGMITDELQQCLTAYASEQVPEDAFIAIQWFAGDEDWSDTVEFNGVHMEVAHLALCLSFASSWFKEGGVYFFERELAGATLVAMSAKPASLRVAERAIWTSDPSWLLISTEEWKGQSRPGGFANPSELIQDRTLVLLDSGWKLKTIKEQMLSVNLEWRNEAGDVVSMVEEVSLSDILDLESLPEIVMFHNPDLKRYGEFMARYNRWISNSQLTPASKVRFMIFAIAPLVAVSRTEFIIRASNRVLAKRDLALPRYRSASYLFMKASLQLSMASAFMSLVTGSATIFQNVLDMPEDLRVATLGGLIGIK